MSATIHHAGDVVKPPATTNGTPGGGSRASPRRSLERFVEAKAQIRTVFDCIEALAADIETALSAAARATGGDSETGSPVRHESLAQVAGARDSLRRLTDMLSRDHMKVVFFGRTSNGKSTVVNAMLGHKVLPAGIGHTTRCFVEVRASPDDTKFIECGDDAHGERRGIESLDQVASALVEGAALGEDTMVRLYWPAGASRLLRNELVLIDSPGVDVTPEADAWIDKHCLDADVFVFVANSESTLTQAERRFFHRVRDRVHRPNIFVLCNRWDASACEPETSQQVRAQHIGQFRQLLVTELNACSADQIPERLFFVSAREALTHRLNEKGIQTPSALLDGHVERLMEFRNFEHQFESCISKSAIYTKFSAHVDRAREILGHMCAVLGDALVGAGETRERLEAEHERRLAGVKMARMQLDHWHAQYKPAAAVPIERAIAALRTRSLFEFHVAVLTGDHLEDFQEDLAFRFSLAPGNVIRRLAAFWRAAASKVSETDSHSSMSWDSFVVPVAAFAANGSVALVLCGFAVYRAIGWRPVAVCGALYGGAYAYERLSWTPAARERVFRKQLAAHLAGRMRSVRRYYAAVCEDEVTRELAEVQGRLASAGNEALQEAKNDLDSCYKRFSAATAAAESLRTLKNKAKFVGTDIESFDKRYLRSDYFSQPVD